MSRKVPKKRFYEKEAEGKKIQRKDPPRHVPWSNPNELRATDRNIAQGLVAEEGIGIEYPRTSVSRRVVSSARYQDTSLGADALVSQDRHHQVFIEERRPGAVREGGLGNEQGQEEDERTIEIGDGEQATVATRDESTVHIIARAVDTEEENRMRHERDQAVRERDQLRQMVNNAVVVSPVVATHTDVENGNENVHAANHDDLPRSDDPKCGTRGRRWFAIGVILLIVVAVAVALALLLPPDPEPSPIPQDLIELISSASSDKGEALSDPSTPQYKALEWLADDASLESFSINTIIQRYALAALYYSANGGIWDDNTLWLDSGEECSRWNELFCTTAGAVSSIRLNINNLKGKIPPGVGLLTSLSECVLWKEAGLCIRLSHQIALH
jgi:hypothetical protein